MLVEAVVMFCMLDTSDTAPISLHMQAVDNEYLLQSSSYRRRVRISSQIPRKSPQGVHLSAVIALGALGQHSAEVVSELVSALKDGEWRVRVRVAVAETVGLLGKHVATAERHCRTLQDDRRDLR